MGTKEKIANMLEKADERQLRLIYYFMLAMGLE